MSLCDNAEAMAKKHSPAREQDRASGHSAGHGHGQGAGQVAGHTDSATHQVPVHVGIEPGRGSPAGVQDDFQRLVDRLRAGRVVLCAGSSLGRDGAPGRLTFTGVLVRLLEEVARQGGDAAEVAAVRGLVDAQPLAVAGFIRRQLGEGFAAALAAAVKPADGELPEALTLCGQLPLRSVVTTLLDGALNQAVSQAAGAGGTPVRSFTALSAAQAREAQQDGRTRYVLQLLGDGLTGEGLVFSETDLQRTLADEPLRQLLHDLYSKRSFLFIGFDPREPEHADTIERYSQRLAALRLPAALLPFVLTTAMQDYIDHAHSVHKALIENWGITVSPDPGSKPLPVGEDAPRWYGVGKAPDYSKPGHPPTPSQDPGPTSGYTPVHTFKHILRTDANRNLGHQFTGVPEPYVGGWRTTEFKGREGEDLVVEDQSTVHQDKDEALKQAKIRNEQAVFEADTFKDIPNPHYKP